MSKSRRTSKPVAAAAGRVLNDPTSTPDERAVAASALSQVEAPWDTPPAPVVARKDSASEGPHGQFSGPAGPAVGSHPIIDDVVDEGDNDMGARGPKAKTQKVVEALENKGLKDAANVARDAAGIARPPLTVEEEFAASVHEVVDAGGQPVGYNPTEGLDDDAATAECDMRLAVLASMVHPQGRVYKVKRDGNRLTVQLGG